MGGKEVARKTTTPQDIINYLNNLCAYAISLGMTPKEYWCDEPSYLADYIRADEYKMRRKNQEFWLQGLYVHIAIGDLVPVLNPFSKEHKPKKYLNEPIPITPKQQEEREQARYEKMKSYMMSLADKK